MSKSARDINFNIMRATRARILLGLASPHQQQSRYPSETPGCAPWLLGSDRALYPHTEKYTVPVAQATVRVAYVPPVLCAMKAVMYSYHENDTCVRLFAKAAVILSPLTQHLAMCMPFSGRVPDFTSLLLLYNGCRTFPIYV